MVDWDQLGDRFAASWKNVGVGLRNVFGSQNERVVKSLRPIVEKVNKLESWAQGMTQEQMIAKTNEWKQGVQSGKLTLDGVMPEAFALVREAGKRALGMRHFDVQLMGGLALHQGNIAEMSTGEGKTLVATLPCYLNALSGKGVFVVTVNDYLAKRDRDWMAPIYEYLGLKVGAIQQWMSPEERKPEYAADITYGTNSEFGFDYLRDNMKLNAEDQVQKYLNFAIVDEVDSILIDEARTPLIISGPAEKSSEKYMIADRVARRLQPGKHFEIKEKEKQTLLTDEGIEHAEELVGVGSFYQGANMDWHHMLETALRAHHLYRIDRDYVVRTSEDDGRPEVVIVDEFTGRMMPGRRWSDGLHQAVEAKEGIRPRDENQTLATITYQNYFRLFKKLGGMTGTAMTEAAEFAKIYNLDVVSIPTNRPISRKDTADVVYRTSQEKWKAIVDEVETVHKKGQPLLIGTTSIEKSELLSGMLQRKGIPHQVLNAKQHEREAHIIVNAGEKGSVTVATNMAGRGTDIKLGEGVKDLGGLYVLGTERHEARRIDNQLRGRSGRQGDPGFSRFYLALEDDLMRIFYSDKTRNLMKMLGMTEGQAIESPMVSRAIEKAQKKVEQRNFEIRKNLLEYDEVMDDQRKVIYRARQDALENKNLRGRCEDMIREVVDAKVDEVLGEKGVNSDLTELVQWVHRKFGIEVNDQELQPFTKETRGSKQARHPLAEHLIQKVLDRYGETESKETPDNMRRIEQYLLLNVIDSKWKDHLYAMDAMKSGISLRGYAQMDPKNEFKQEGFKLFRGMLASIADAVTEQLFKLHVPTREEVESAREAERRREDAQRVFQAAMDAGVEQQEATQIAQAVYAGQIEAHEMIQKIMAAKAQAENAAAAAAGAAEQLSPELQQLGADAQRAFAELVKAGIVQPIAMQVAQSILEKRLVADEVLQKVAEWKAQAGETSIQPQVEALIPADLRKRHESAARVFQIAVQSGIAQQQAAQMAQAVFEQKADANDLIEKIIAAMPKPAAGEPAVNVAGQSAGAPPATETAGADSKPASEVPPQEIPPEIRKKAEDAQRVFDQAVKSGVAQPQAVQLAQSVVEGKLNPDELLQKMLEWKAAAGDQPVPASVVDEVIPADVRTRHENAQRVFQAATQAGVVPQQASQVAQAVFAGQANADDMIRKIQEARASLERQQAESQQKAAESGENNNSGRAEENNNSAGAPRAQQGMQVPLRNAFDAHKHLERRNNAGKPPAAAAPQNPGAEPGRNDPCHCGSGRKYKQCHGRSSA